MKRRRVTRMARFGMSQSEGIMKAIRAASLIRAVFAVPMLCVVLLVSCSDSPQALVASAKNYMSKGDYKAAAIQLKNALQQTPNDAEARYLLGTALERSRDLIDAESELRKAMALGYPP